VSTIEARNGVCRSRSFVVLTPPLASPSNKFLLDGFFSVERTWRNVCAVRNVSDFKTVTSYRLIGKDQYELVAPGGEIKHGSIKEMTYPFRVDTFAKMLSLDRRDVVNDDLSLFDEAARNLGRAAMRSLSDLVFQVLLANAGNFFSGGHANYDTGPATALSSASLGAGIAKMISPSDFCLV
jgi:phage major head subunit gpT-like protein